jgi:hypothetical protein
LKQSATGTVRVQLACEYCISEMPLFEGSVVPTGDPGRTGPHDTSGTTFSDFQFLVFAKTHSACPLCPRQLTFPNGLAWPLCAKRKTGNIVWIKIMGGYQLRLPKRKAPDSAGALYPILNAIYQCEPNL